jgi:hypothetical protein
LIPGRQAPDDVEGLDGNLLTDEDADDFPIGFIFIRLHLGTGGQRRVF